MTRFYGFIFYEAPVLALRPCRPPHHPRPQSQFIFILSSTSRARGRRDRSVRRVGLSAAVNASEEVIVLRSGVVSAAVGVAVDQKSLVRTCFSLEGFSSRI